MNDEYIPKTEAPGELLKTRIIMLDDAQSFEELGMLCSYDAVRRASNQMTHGEIKAMKNWTLTQGGTPPWQIKRIFGVIPLPWLTIASLLILVIASIRGFPMDWSVIIFLVTLIGLLGLGFWLAEYKYDRVGICLIGGEPVSNRYRKSIQVFDHKGRPKQIAQSGYCEEHAWTVHRATLWTILESQVWQGIINNPIKSATIFRKIGYAMFWWVGYREQFVDPRDVAHGIIYERKDRTRPRDQLNENIVDSTVASLFMAIDNLQRLKKMRRKA